MCLWEGVLGRSHNLERRTEKISPSTQKAVVIIEVGNNRNTDFKKHIKGWVMASQFNGKQSVTSLESWTGNFVLLRMDGCGINIYIYIHLYHTFITRRVHGRFYQLDLKNGIVVLENLP